MSGTPFGKAWDSWLAEHLHPDLRRGYTFELAQNAFHAGWSGGINFATDALAEDKQSQSSEFAPHKTGD